MKSKTLICLAASLLVLVMVIIIVNSVRAAQVQSPPSAVTHSPSREVGAPPDATYGESIETPNHRRQRLAAEEAEASGVPSPDACPSADVLSAAEDSTAKPVEPASAPTPARKKKQKVQAPPKVAETNAPQSATAADAVAVGDRWQNTRNTPAEGKDGRVVYADGAGLATVVCAPLRLCIVELQSGEKISGEPQIGDSVRWGVEPASYGSGERATPLIVLKPKAVGLDTNLVITTDRRAYYLRLISSSQDYVAKVSFDYPDDERIHWAEALSKQEKATQEAEYERELKTLAKSVEDLNVDYRVKGDKSIRPIRVLDDGAHTYLQMNPAISHREAPVLAVIGPDGKAEIVNYRVKGGVYIVDRLFDRARLILGSGRKARKADIISGAGKGRRLLAQDPTHDDIKEEQPQ